VNRAHNGFPSSPEICVHSIRLALRALGAVALLALVATLLPLHSVRADVPGGLDLSTIDPTCNACDDFYKFATGGWTEHNTIPPGHASWGSFDELVQHNREALHVILEDDAKVADAPAGSDTQKLGTFYRACMDEDAIERAGTTPIDPLLARVAAVHDVDGLVATLGALQVASVNDGLEPLPGVHENGKLVQGEAIADLGGTTIAFRAFERTAEYKSGKPIDGYTPAQRFFLAYAQVWRGIQTEAMTRQLAVVDPHPNDRLRVIGTLSNMPAFAAAFHCAATSAMVRKDWCQIW
jgi:predicted metalloendopeptidase